MQKKRHPEKKRREITVEIDLLPIFSVALILLVGVLLFFSVLGFIKGFLKIDSFKIVGDCPYEASELAAGADIKKGDKLYKIDVREAEEKILLNCNYIEKIKIKRSFPNKMKFVVESYEPVWYLEISGDFYVLDSELRVLEETKNAQRLYESNLIKLTLPKVKTAIVGETLTFGGSEGEIEATFSIMETILTSPAFEMISGADMDNRYDMHFEFDRVIIPIEGSVDYKDLTETFAVNVGSYGKLETKLEYIVRALLAEKLEGVTGGVIDVSEEGDKVSIRPTYSNNEDTEE